ncbi:MAG: hypothetical protein H8E30_12565 [Alphaproteobacteria bacterium]|nr:hypothetical protein [Alphaproteobacteria bacterium]
MSPEKANVSIRPARPDDTRELCALLNEIILLGGSTAMETPLTDAEFGNHFLAPICCTVAVDDAGLLADFRLLRGTRSYRMTGPTLPRSL